MIFLAEAGEEGTTRVGIQFMVEQHFPESTRNIASPKAAASSASGGRVRYASVQTLEKIPRAIELTARGVAGHGSVPLETNAVAQSGGRGRRARPVAAADPAERNHAAPTSIASRRSRRLMRPRAIAPCSPDPKADGRAVD